MNRGGGLTLKIKATSEREDIQTSLKENTLLLTGQCPDGGVHFCIGLKAIVHGGATSIQSDALFIEAAEQVTLLVDIQTSYRETDPVETCCAQLEKAATLKVEELYQRHLDDHQTLYHRVDLSFVDEDRTAIPTDERIQTYREGTKDVGLEALLFHYGRYLLIASSRENTLPGHLQGVWNDNKASHMCWTCDYHLDINTQQNYWPAEVCNLPECHEAAFRFVESLVEPGRETAKHYYQAPGWVAHVFTNLWGYTPPGWSERWGLHPTGGLWMALHLVDHVDFTGDKTFLRERAYPLLKEAADFFMHFMIKDPNTGYLVTAPSASPENVYLSKEGEAIAVSVAPTCDRILIEELLRFCIKSAQTLDLDQDMIPQWEEALNQLPPYQIGKHGQLQEWLMDFDEAEPEHRHLMHLLGLYPFAQITPAKTPELARAADRVLDRKMTHPKWEETEWGRAWNINFYARLRDAQKAHDNIRSLIKLCDQNLLTLCPPHGGSEEDIFVLDGNAAGTAGIAECLLQSHSGQIELLPTLPSAWSTGSLRGFRARGGWSLDMDWQEGQLQHVKLSSHTGGTCQLVYGDLKTTITLEAEQSLQLDATLTPLETLRTS